VLETENTIGAEIDKQINYVSVSRWNLKHLRVLLYKI